MPIAQNITIKGLELLNMPKRGGGKTRNWNADHFEHDDRVHSNNRRRVPFKPGTNKAKNKFHVLANPKLLLDDDISMGISRDPMQNRKGTFRGHGNHSNSASHRPNHAMSRKKFIAGSLPWYRILIPYGAKHEKDVVLRSLLSFISPDIFIPYYYKVNGNAAVFYVDDVKVAEKLFYADRKITMSDGFKLVVIVRNGVPTDNIDDNMKQKMKLVMAKRYNAVTKALDLTKFHTDPDLVDLFCPLFRPIIMIAAIDIIEENIPDIEALNLNDNKLHGIDHLKRLSTKLKHLKILYLSDNKITHIGSLDSLKSLPLVELFLKGNPLLNKFKDHDLYVSLTSVAIFFVESSDIRKKFPKLIRLDGVDLPPAIGFDVNDEAALPAFQQSFLIDPAGQDLVREFLTQYFAIYDSESRQQLLEAYHEDATMSLAVNYLTNDNRNPAITRLGTYMPNNRNLLRVKERESRRRYLKMGKLQIVSLLSELPKTTHDLMGFAVDLLVFTPTMIVLTMNGVFKETTTSGNPSRSFHRTFVIVPNTSGGFSILNDMLYITNIVKEQVVLEQLLFEPITNGKKVFEYRTMWFQFLVQHLARLTENFLNFMKEEKVFSSGVTVTALAPAAPQSSIAPAIAPAAPIAQDAHNALISMLSQQTGMNHHWSMNCLQETQWDLQRALFIFNQLHSEGKIPPEAFTK